VHRASRPCAGALKTREHPGSGEKEKPGARYGAWQPGKSESGGGECDGWLPRQARPGPERADLRAAVAARPVGIATSQRGRHLRVASEAGVPAMATCPEVSASAPRRAIGYCLRQSPVEFA
jgi:hypothetical protein